MKIKLVIFFLIIGWGALIGQTVQTVRGVVLEQETQLPLAGATVQLLDTTLKKGAITDEKGNFRIEGVPVGKHSLRVKYVGFHEKVLDIQISSAKEVVLTIFLEEGFTQTEEVVIEAGKRGEVQNELAFVSTRSFEVSETERYAGSRGDPARMASNYAGVQGADDSRNDIVVRGNTPLGVLYRVENIDIPNPNHFAVSGSTGGPVSILNNKTLANSDFFTSAFPAEYGNAISAVFDLKLRQGNNEKHEQSAQIGFLGTELAVEGPLNKKTGASYLAAYRYSTLQLFKMLGISIGTDAVPKYQDGTFKLHFPLKNQAAFSVWGMGGMSSIDIVISNQKKPSTDFYGDDDRDQYFRTRMAVLATQYQKLLGQKTFLKAGLAFSHERQSAEHFYIIRHLNSQQEWVVDSLYNILRFAFNIHKATSFLTFNSKLSARHTLKYGIFFHQIFFHLRDSALTYDHSHYQVRWNYTGNTTLVQAFIQWKSKISEKFSYTIGLHHQYFALTKSISWAEPRIGLNYQISQKQNLFAGTGLHSQVQPYYVYFYQKFDSMQGQFVMENRNMDFTRSFHSVIGYENRFNATIRLRIEAYYQYLFNIPVEIQPSAFSLTNMGSGFSRFFPQKTQNSGLGRNYGMELTLEKFFSQTFYFLITASLFDAKYQGSDKVWRNTDFNARYASNLLLGKEFKIKKKNTLGLGTKTTWAGGRWYGPADTTRSRIQQELVFIDSTYNTLQFRPYFRQDLKLYYKINAKKFTHEIALDLVNILNTKNILNLTYSPNPFDPTASPVRENYQLGFLPLFYYRLDF